MICSRCYQEREWAGAYLTCDHCRETRRRQGREGRAAKRDAVIAARKAAGQSLGKYATGATEGQAAAIASQAADALMGVMGMAPVPAHDALPAQDGYADAQSGHAPVAPKADVAQPRNNGNSGNDSVLPSDVQRLVIEAKRAPAFDALCNRLDLSPSRCEALLERARSLGVQLQVEHSRIGLASPAPRDDVQTVGIPPVVGQPQRVAVLSDPHFGSKYCLRAQVTDFIDHAYRLGCREVLCPGDLLDGEYKHGIFEVSHSGLDAQAGDLFDSLPQRDGLTYRAITGNHCGTFAEASGLDVGTFLEQHFKARGRNDLRFYGNRGAFLKVLGATIHLWHPKSGMSYARSYAVQKQIEKYGSGEKPHILLCGHWHQFVHVHERGVHGIACPTFQGGGSAFAKSIGGSPAIGGLVLTWTLTEHATMRDLSLEFRAYFERERAREVA